VRAGGAAAPVVRAHDDVRRAVAGRDDPRVDREPRVEARERERRAVGRERRAAFTLAGFDQGLALDAQVVTAGDGTTNVVVRADDRRCGATCPLALEGRVVAVGGSGVTVDPGDGGPGDALAAAEPALLQGVRPGDAVVVFGRVASNGDVVERLVMARRAAA